MKQIPPMLDTLMFALGLSPREVSDFLENRETVVTKDGDVIVFDKEETNDERD
ncbi:MAG: hypothetical protein Q4G59_06110 [Planctomycetia bacterium]|nr:hypothetical protein [Planctomycetia bacterium]